MSEYEKALSYVHDVLRDLQSHGSALTASVPVLAALAAQGAIAPASTRKAAEAAGQAAPPKAVEPTTLRSPVAPPPARSSLPARAPVPVLPSLPPLAAAAPTGAPGSQAERFDAWREAILQSSPPDALARYAHPHLVFGSGRVGAELLFIGEAPGEEEPLTQDPLENEAGGILMKMIGAMGLAAGEVYIAQTLRVRPEKRGRPSEHRQPTPAERQWGLQQLQELIALLQPRALVALGASAVEGLLGISEPIGKVRSQWFDYRGIPLLATYHPAYLVRNQANSEKRKVWTDMLLVLEKLGHPISEKQRGYFLAKGGTQAGPG